MTSIVKGHGERIDDTETFVPTGTKVMMFSGYDVDLSTTSALVAIASGSFASPNDEAEDGGPIANYELSTQDDGFYAQWYAMGAAASTALWWVGTDLDDGIRLCNLDGDCDESEGTHGCTGVFGQVKDDLIVLLACRGYAEADGPTATEQLYGTDVKDPLHTITADSNAWMQSFLTRANADPDAAEQEYDALPQGTIALLSSTSWGDTWTRGRWVRTFADADDPEGLVNHLLQNTDGASNVVFLMNHLPAYGAAFDACVARHPAAFKDFIDAEGDPWESLLEARPAFVAALQGIRRAEPDLEWADFENLNRDYLKTLAEDAGAIFWQLGDTLVIGGQYRTPYGQVLLDNGGSQGTITMAARGTTFSAGEVYVEGASDEAAFERAFKKLSGKTVKFGH
jgi:hypothetical protein